MTTTLFRAAFVGVTVSAIAAGYAPSVRAADRFEVERIKAVRPTLVEHRERAAEGKRRRRRKRPSRHFDSALERDRGVHQHAATWKCTTTLERVLQAKLTEGARTGRAPNAPDAAGPDAEGDAREVRRGHCHGREGGPAQPAVRRCRAAPDRAGAPARGESRRSRPATLAEGAKVVQGDFDEKWDSIEDLVKSRSSRSLRRD